MSVRVCCEVHVVYMHYKKGMRYMNNQTASVETHVLHVNILHMFITAHCTQVLLGS